MNTRKFHNILFTIAILLAVAAAIVCKSVPATGICCALILLAVVIASCLHHMLTILRWSTTRTEGPIMHLAAITLCLSAMASLVYVSY